MELNRIQFDILSTIAENNNFSIDGFSNITTYSIQDIKKEIDTLNFKIKNLKLGAEIMYFI